MYQIHFNQPVHIHFIGIGGISMSGLAEILLEEHFTVSGSDSAESELTRHLAAAGAHIFYGQRAENITPEIGLVVYTAAVHADNPEYQAAQKAGIPMLSRAQLLGQMMNNYAQSAAIAGTHGKTTTTSMFSHILLAAGSDPTISVGGILPAINGNIRVGHSAYFVTEACEYTNSFLEFFPKYSVILNVEEDHLDFFKDLDDIRDSFRRFASQTPADGTVIVNHAIAGIRDLLDGIAACVVTFGPDRTSDFYPENISYTDTGNAHFQIMHHGSKVCDAVLNVPGAHNISNALAAAALAVQMHLPSEAIAEGLAAFGGTDRRFQLKGTRAGVTVIDDYAHHPTEITATLSAAANYPHKRILCVFQPHTYSRTKAFLNEFAASLSAADLVVLADIYAARETDDLGVSSKDILAGLKERGVESYYFSTFEKILEFLSKKTMNGDLLITMGAGDILKVGESFLEL